MLYAFIAIIIGKNNKISEKAPKKITYNRFLIMP